MEVFHMSEKGKKRSGEEQVNSNNNENKQNKQNSK